MFHCVDLIVNEHPKQDVYHTAKAT